MDLIGCPRCNERFLLRDTDTEGWSCPNCRAEMRVVAHRIPDGIVTPDVSDSGDPQHVVRSMSGTPFQSW
jgi:PHP family Zn ribbon phosphoesterase